MVSHKLQCGETRGQPVGGVNTSTSIAVNINAEIKKKNRTKNLPLENMIVPASGYYSRSFNEFLFIPIPKATCAPQNTSKYCHRLQSCVTPTMDERLGGMKCQCDDRCSDEAHHDAVRKKIGCMHCLKFFNSESDFIAQYGP